MITNTTQENLKELPRFLQRTINAEIERAITEELAEVQKRIDKRKSEIIAGVILHVEKMVQMQTIGEKLIITVKTD